MKIAFVTLISVFILLNIYSQENLVPNPGFEDYQYCPSGFGGFEASINVWENASETPEYFHICSAPSAMGIPENYFGYQQAFAGNAYAGIGVITGSNFREYAVVQLIQPLVAGDTYYISFYVSLCDITNYGINNFGAFLSANQVTGSQLINQNAQVEYWGNLHDKENWTLIEGSFVAQGGEEYLYLGVFATDSEIVSEYLGGGSLNSMIYYVDEVSLTLTDTEAPVIQTVFEDQGLFADLNCVAEIPDYRTNIIVDDNFDGEITIEQNPEPGSFVSGDINTIIITASDEAGNQSSVEFNVEIIDNTPPQINCTESYEHWLAPGEISWICADNILNPISVSDNCGWENLTNDYDVSSNLNGVEFLPGLYTIIWMVEDYSSNTAECQSSLMVHADVSNVNGSTFAENEIVFNNITQTILIPAVFNFGSTDLFIYSSDANLVHFNQICNEISFSILNLGLKQGIYFVRISNSNICRSSVAKIIIL